MGNVRNSIKCHCGQRVMARDVMQTGYYLRLFGPSFVYVKYRCCRCKKLGEQFVKQEEWDGGILRDQNLEVASDERETYEALGPIDINEVIDFHFQLENTASLKDLGFDSPEVKAEPRSRKKS